MPRDNDTGTPYTDEDREWMMGDCNRGVPPPKGGLFDRARKEREREAAQAVAVAPAPPAPPLRCDMCHEETNALAASYGGRLICSRCARRGEGE